MTAPAWLLLGTSSVGLPSVIQSPWTIPAAFGVRSLDTGLDGAHRSGPITGQELVSAQVTVMEGRVSTLALTP